MSKDHINLFRRAMKLGTVEDRIIKMTEEIGELLVAITHLQKKKKYGIETYQDKMNLLEEMADVEICIDILKDFYLNGDNSFYEKIKDKKIQKLELFISGKENVLELQSKQ